jgi:hypothetical protein
MDNRDLTQIQKFGQTLGVVAIVFVFRSVNQPELTRVSDKYSLRNGSKQVVKVAIATAGLVADFKSVFLSFKNLHHLVDRSNFLSTDHLTCLVENADEDVLAVDIESNV